MFGLFPMNENGITNSEKVEICAFADGALLTADESSPVQPFTNDNIIVKDGNADGINEKDLKNPVLTGLSGNLTKYITRGAKAISYIIKTQIKAK